MVSHLGVLTAFRPGPRGCEISGLKGLCRRALVAQAFIPAMDDVGLVGGFKVLNYTLVLKLSVDKYHVQFH